MDTFSDTLLCPICGEVSELPHQVHYGGVACFSCRAFFRRAHQKTKAPNFNCKRGGNCEVTVENRRRCQKCRYNLCLTNGMRPDSVLTDDQKKIRFRNMIRKRGSRKTEAYLSRDIIEDTDGSDEEDPVDSDKVQRVVDEETLPIPSQDDEIESQSKSRKTESSSSLEMSSTTPYKWNSSSNSSPSSSRFLNEPASSSSTSSSSISSPFSCGLSSSSNKSCSDSTADSPGCCQTTSFASCAPKISIGGFNKKKMAVNEMRSVFLMPCYNYCPIASTSERKSPQVADSSCSSGDKCDCRVSKPCCSTDGGPSSFEKNSITTHKMMTKDLKKKCPVIGDIENWPPIVDDDRSEAESSDPPVGTLKLRTWRPTSQSSGGIGWCARSTGKTVFEDPTGGGESANLDSGAKNNFGEGPFLFDLSSVPPAPSRGGQTEVERLIYAYNLSGSQLEVDQEFIKRLISFHKGFVILPRGLWKNYLTCLGQQFRHFALQHQRFVTLNKMDQRRLLLRNSSLFIQYIMGKYFSAATGIDQLQWLLGSRCPDVSELSDVQRIGLPEFNGAVKLFRKGTYLDMYEEFANRLSNTNTEQEFNPVMAHFFLFAFDSSDKFVDPATIAELHADSFRMCPHSRHFLHCSRQPNITGVIETTEAMANFFGTNATWTDVVLDSDEVASSGSESSSSDNNLRRKLTVPYCQEEENWLCRQMALFNEAYAAVPLGEDIIKESVMFSYDVPVSKHFVPVTLSVMSERFKRVMRMHPEFEALTSTEQARLFMNNAMNAVAIYVAKMESCKTFSQQCQFAFGALDDAIFERDYSHVIKANKMRKISLFETNKSTHLLTERMMSDVERLVSKITPIISDIETFKLICLITLFTCAGDTIPSIARLRNQYLNVLRRRPFRENKRAKLEGSQAHATALFKQFTSCMCDIQELAALMNKVKSCMPDSFEYLSGSTF